MRSLRWLRLALTAAILSSCVWLVYLYFGGNGTLTLNYHFSGPEQAISRLQPSGRALDLEMNQDNGESYQRVVGEPVYFTVALPGSYDSVEVTLEYQNPNQNLIELGIKQTPTIELFDYLMQPLENKLVDESAWESIQNDHLVLLQKHPTYDSIEEFLANPPLDAHVATYNNAPLPEFIDSSYVPNLEQGSEIDVTLRGAHDFYSYATAGEALNYKVELHSIDYVPGDDVATVRLIQQDTILSTVTITNNGIAELAAIAPVTGVYRLAVSISDDMMITHLQSSQERLVAGRTLHLAGSTEYLDIGQDINTVGTTIHTDANWISFIAKHSYGVGEYAMYDGGFLVSKVNTPYVWTNPIPNQHHSFTALHNDLYLQSDSYFALPGAVEFDPWFGFRSMHAYMEADHLDYILSGLYTAPSRLRGWTTATAHFDLTSVTQTNPNQLQFMLSAPGLETTPLGLKIKTITVTAHQSPLTLSYLWEKLFGAN